jgi:hypothetical protein
VRARVSVCVCAEGVHTSGDLQVPPPFFGHQRQSFQLGVLPRRRVLLYRREVDTRRANALRSHADMRH